MTIAILQGYIRSAGNGWDYTMDLLGRYYEQALGYTEVHLGLLGYRTSAPAALRCRYQRRPARGDLSVSESLFVIST